MNLDANDGVTRLEISCPSCGESLHEVPGNDELLGCIGNHTFTIPTLLMGQSMRASALIEAGARLLEQQRDMVLWMAREIPNPVVSFRLAGQADQLTNLVAALREIVTNGCTIPDETARPRGGDNAN